MVAPHLIVVRCTIERQVASSPWVGVRAVWLAVRPSADHLFVFTGKGGLPLKASGVQDMLGELGRVAGVAVTPHTLRHTFAKNLIDRGVPLNQVATLLGHSALNTTRIYTTPSEADLERAVGLVGD